MRRKISGAVILGLVTGLLMLALPAQAHSFWGEGDCDGWTLHLDGTWSAYDITVDGASIGLEQNPVIADDSENTSRTFVVRWWKQGPDVERTVTVERVLECETTTTMPEETTTTEGDTTTTTSIISTTTTEFATTTTSGQTSTTAGNDTTTTSPEGLVSHWSASSHCSDLVAEWGDGIIQVDVYQRISEGDFGPADGVTPFTESGQVKTVAGAFADTEWLLVPVVLSGYEAVPAQISLVTEECTPDETTTLPELPFTGSSTPWMALIVSGMATVLVGAGLVKAFQEREDA